MILTASDYERLLIWKGSLKAWIQHPWFGWGPDNFLQAFRANRGIDYIDSKALNGSQLGMQADAHNIFLQILTTTGIGGLFAFIYFLSNVLSVLRHTQNKQVRASIIALLAGSMFEPVSFSCWVLAAMLLGSIS